MQKNRKIVVSDLDGTLIRINSFPLWVKYIFIRSLKSFRVLLCFKILIFLLRRKVLGLSHFKFKELLINTTYPSSYDRDFVITLKPFINLELASYIGDLVSDGHCFYISTAAPRNYAKYVYELFDTALINTYSTHLTNEGMFENLGSKKVLSFNEDGNDHIDVFFTDHHDDIPMMNISEASFLVEPSSETIDVLNNLDVKYNGIFKSEV